MASPNYDTASTYLNNLLLARGLLSDGAPIPFSKITIADSSSETRSAVNDDSKSSSSSSSSTGRIINLVHDLVLRRDRDAEHKETLTSTIRALRAEETRHVLHVQTLQDKTASLASQLNTVEGQIRSYKQEIRRCEREVKSLVEQNGRLKSGLDQARAKGISEVQAREVELRKLRDVVAGINRGAKKEFDPKNTRLQKLKSGGGKKMQSARDRDRGDLRCAAVEDSVFAQESPEMLTALLNETSTENVALRKILEDSMRFLTNLTDLDSVDSQQQQQTRRDPLDEFGTAIGIPGQYRESHNPLSNHESTTSSETSKCDTLVPVSALGQEMSKVLQHCRTILKDPSFVPIEEVHIREKEIEKLKVGWEKMADRWREAVGMMGSWRREMMESQHEYEIETISDRCQQTLEEREKNTPEFLPASDRETNPFRRSIALRPDGRPVLDPIEEEEFTSLLEEHRSRLIERSILSIHADVEGIGQHDVVDDSLAEPDARSTPRLSSSVRVLSSATTNMAVAAAQTDDEDAQSSLEPWEPQDRVSETKNLTSPARRGVKLVLAGADPATGLKRKPISQFDLDTASVKRRARTAHGSSGDEDEHEHEHDSTYMSSTSTSTSASTGSNSNSSAHISHPVAAPASASALHGLDIDKLVSDSDTEVDNLFHARRDGNSHRMTVAEKLAAMEAEAAAVAVAVATAGIVENSEPTEPTEVIRRKQALVPDEKRAKTRDRDRTLDRRSGKKEKEERKRARDRRRSTLTPAELGALMR